MRERYKRRIRDAAKRHLLSRLARETKPYLGFVPDRIEKKIITYLDGLTITEDVEGSELQKYGVAIADKLFDRYFQQVLPIIDKELKEQKIDLEEDRVHVELSKETLKLLELRVTQELVRQSRRYWCGADTFVTPERIPKEALPRIRTVDVQVVTQSRDLALSISWLFERIWDVMVPLQAYTNKYEFYRSLAIATMIVINWDEGANEKDVFTAVLEKAKTLHEKSVQSFERSYDQENISLQEGEDWLLKHRQKAETGNLVNIDTLPSNASNFH